MCAEASCNYTAHCVVKMPFNHFFETVCIQGFFSASIAGAFGGAVLNRWLKVAADAGMHTPNNI